MKKYAQNNITRGNFQWVNGIKDTKVMFYPDPKGRFKITWTPPVHLQNNVKEKRYKISW